MEELKDLISQRGILKGSLTRFSNYISQVENEEASKSQLKVRLRKIEEVWKSFSDIQSKIESIDDNKEAQEEERVQFEDKYYELTSKAEHLIGDNVDSQSNTNSSVIERSSNGTVSQPMAVKLPPLPKLVTFSGNYEEWMSFHDTFKAVIMEHPALSDVQKFQYLKSALSGNAFKEIATLSLTAANFPVAWKLLTDRYQNKRIIIEKHVQGLFNLPSAEKESSVALRSLIDSAQMHLRALEALNQPTAFWDTIMLYLITSKFDKTSFKEWESKIKTEEPTFEQLIQFINNRAKILESLESRNISKTEHAYTKEQPKNTKRNWNFDKSKHTNTFVSQEETCGSCGSNHPLFSCNKFRSLPVEKRREIVKQSGVCFNCLKTKHRAENCFSGKCRVCNKKHNTLLHLESDAQQKHDVPNASNTSISTSHTPAKKENDHLANDDVHVGHAVTNHSREVLLSTVLLDVSDANGSFTTCRALLDNGSQSNFITQELSNRLGLQQTKIDISIRGINQVQSNITHSVITSIRSKHSSFQASMKSLVISNISGNLPAHRVDISAFNIPKNIELADHTFQEPSSVDMLIGSDLFWDILGTRKIKLAEGGPYLRDSLFGWIVVGTVVHNCYLVCYNTQVMFNSQINEIQSEDDHLDKKLERFWQLEEAGSHPSRSEEEKKCEQYFLDTYKRSKDGRFTVRLPVKDNVNQLGDSYNVALNRFLKLEHRLFSNTDLSESYKAFMAEYLDLQHMQLIPEEDIITNSPTYYMPHHAVLKSESTTTKLRVVFDASAKSSTGISLNDTLMIGGVVQQDLFSITLRFRSHHIVLTADIEKMYRQIKVHEEDTNLQRILWRDNEQENIHHYRLETVTYGTASAPYLATRCLMQLAKDEESDLPLASKAALTDFYMDDLLTGCDQLQQAIELRQELIELCQRGEFSLRKWCSNRQELINDLPDNLKETSYNFDSASTIKTLGLFWDPTLDQFAFRIKLSSQTITKRTVLSDMCKIFDPLGLIVCVTSSIKIFMQKLWQSKIDWDETLPRELHTEWEDFRSQLPLLDSIQIPRLVNPYRSDIQLHGFSDASEVAYAACIYIRSSDNQGNINTTLLCAKSRVAPIDKNKIQLPRLELCAALLLANLTFKVLQALSHIHFSQIVLWSDSTVTLCWIKTPSSTLKTFVSNRVAEIQRLTENYIWRYVPSESNPADLPSRGIKPSLLHNNTLWWHGPDWLKREEAFWPQLVNPIISQEVPERKGNKVWTMLATQDKFIENYSTLKRLLRITSYIFRYINNLKRKSKGQELITGTLSPEELHNTLMYFIKIAQEQRFHSEIRALKKGEHIHNKSELKALNPFIDESGILRVGGRLLHSSVHRDQKFPIVLPNKHHLTKLIATNEHWNNLHCGQQALLASLRRQYWPIKGRNLVRKIVHSCIRCSYSNPKNLNQQMGNLPKSRIEPSRPFTHTGVDFCGPIYTKNSIRRGSSAIKSYIAIFVCFTTHAIHIELVSNLSSAAFIAALKRFIARRGKCSDIYSDNATNFVGSNKELRDLNELFNSKIHSQSITDFVSDKGISWHFTPPRSPHFGGLWEAAVKSVKFHLKRILGAHTLTFEEAYTCLTQIEACVNSRPLTPISSDPHDLIPLTPAHFLIGEPLTTTAEPDLQSIPTNRLTRWKQVQQMVHHFWSRWSKEYLSTLQARSKWTKKNPNIQIGDMVLVKDEQQIPLKWPLARVESLHPGTDGLCRVATVRTTRGLFKRAITKLCPLPMETSTSHSEQDF